NLSQNFLVRDLQSLKRKLHKARVEMNRILSSRSKLNATLEGNARRARSRMLIQVGGIVKLSGLFPICQIEEGEDLQYDIDSRDKAALLLGILLDAAHNISD